MTNAILEDLNSVIQFVKRAARGFRATGYFETMIFLRLGRLDFSAQLAVSSVTRQKQRRALIKGLVSSKIEWRILRASATTDDGRPPRGTSTPDACAVSG